MAARRKSDPVISRSKFRTDRMVCNAGSWYFLTREGSVEGPFDCQADAEEQLEVYIQLLESGMFSPESKFALAN